MSTTGGWLEHSTLDWNRMQQRWDDPMCVDGQIAIVLDPLKLRRRDVGMTSRRLPLQRRHAVLAQPRTQTSARNAGQIGRIASFSSSAVTHLVSIVMQPCQGQA